MIRTALWIGLGSLAVGCTGGDAKDAPKGDRTDLDQDGFDSSDDCDDSDPDVFPNANEVPYDGIDQDCNGTDLVDVDQDGFDAVDAGGDDCNDTDPDTWPGASDDAGDDVDQNCDGVDGLDADGDGVAAVSSGGTDCDDADSTIFPGATEVWYDGVDQSCDDHCDWDQDGDGYLLEGHEPVDDGSCDRSPTPGEVRYQTDCLDTDPAGTDNFLVGTVPPDLDVEVFPGDAIEVDLMQFENGATVRISDPLGVLLMGVTAWDGTTLIFAPDVPLAPLTTFDAEITWSCGVHTWSFTTSDFGAPTDVTTLAGRSYALDLGAANWVEPLGVGALLAAQFNEPLLLGVVAADATSIDLLAGVALSGTDQQDLCIETRPYPTADFTGNPQLVAGPIDYQMSVAGFDLLYQDIHLNGTFTPSGDLLTAGTFSAEIDTRPLVDLIAPGGDDDAVCQLVATFGVPCFPCPDLAGPYCLRVRVEDIEGPEVPGQTLVSRDATDISDDAACP